MGSCKVGEKQDVSIEIKRVINESISFPSNSTVLKIEYSPIGRFNVVSIVKTTDDDAIELQFMLPGIFLVTRQTVSPQEFTILILMFLGQFVQIF